MKLKITDLTMTLRDGQPGVEFETKYTVAENGWNAKTLHLYSHTGTHMDSPFHFGVTPQTLDQISLDRLLVTAHVANLEHLEPKGLITVADLGETATQINAGDALLLRTNWSQFFDQPKYYRDNFPRISEELARWIVEKKVGILGVEPCSVADVNNLQEVTLIHQILLGGDVVIVEGLTNLETLPQSEIVFGAMPLKIGDGDGAPCRAFAIEGLVVQ